MNEPPAPRPLGSKSLLARPRRVLIVEDDVAVRQALQRWFSRRGWSVVEAADGDKARACLAPDAAQQFDLILCDVRMPELSGPELFNWLSVAQPELIPCLVFTTGDASEGGVAEFLRASQCAVLEKPFELDDLFTVVERVLPRTVTA